MTEEGHEGMSETGHAGHNAPATNQHASHIASNAAGPAAHSVPAAPAGHAVHSVSSPPDAHADHAMPTAASAHRTHVDHSGHETMFRRRFWVSLALSVPVLLYSPMIQHWLGFTMPAFPGSPWLTPVLSVVIFLYGGLPFLQMARPEVRNRQPGMMLLISLAISVAFVYSLATLFLPGRESFFWELVTLIDIMLLGHWVEMRSVRQASGALDALARLMPDTAERVNPHGAVEIVRAEELLGGDIVLVRPGANIPADGEVVEGESDVNEAMLTGESRPVGKTVGDRVIAGAINGDGSLRVRVTATGDKTALAGIMRLVQEAQTSKSHTQVLADKAAGWLFYVAIGVAMITAIAWTVAQGFDVDVIARVATVLVIACPHALGLAIPLVVSITTALGARNGILVADRLALERAREIDTVIFDKTGTLTKGEFGVVGVAVPGHSEQSHEAAQSTALLPRPHDAWTADQALALAAAIEGDSEHTIARGIRAAASERGLSLPAVSGFEAIKGRGARAIVDGSTWQIGGPRLLEALAADLPPELAKFEEMANARGQTTVFLVGEQANGSAEVRAAFALADVIRDESRAAVRKLHDMGVQVAMLTGDAEAVARSVAEDLGIDTYFAEVLPEHKDQKVIELQRQGRRVAMVGDGVNDAPALTRADVGIAIGSGTDVAVQSAGIILVQSNPLDVVRVIGLSRSSHRKMVQNLLWATGYNVIALPLAAGVLAPVGIVLSPAVGAVLMSLSTIVVALNAQLLRRLDLSAQ